MDNCMYIRMVSVKFPSKPEGEQYTLTNAKTAAKHIQLGWGKLKKDVNKAITKEVESFKNPITKK